MSRYNIYVNERREKLLREEMIVRGKTSIQEVIWEIVEAYFEKKK